MDLQRSLKRVCVVCVVGVTLVGTAAVLTACDVQTGVVSASPGSSFESKYGAGGGNTYRSGGSGGSRGYDSSSSSDSDPYRTDPYDTSSSSSSTGGRWDVAVLAFVFGAPLLMIGLFLGIGLLVMRRDDDDDEPEVTHHYVWPQDEAVRRAQTDHDADYDDWAEEIDREP